MMAFWCYGSAEIVGQSGDCHPAIFPGSGCHLRWYHRREHLQIFGFVLHALCAESQSNISWGLGGREGRGREP